MRRWLTVLLAILAGGCAVKEKEPVRRRTPAAEAAAEAAPAAKAVPRKAVLIGTISWSGLRAEIREVGAGVFSFRLEPETAPGEAVEIPESAPVRFDAETGELALMRGGEAAWAARVEPLASFGRASVPGIELRWKAGAGEVVYGLGERFDSLNQAGKVVDMWIEDAPGQGETSRQSYYVTPVLYSGRGYAFFAAQNPEGEFDLNSAGDGWHRYRRAGQAMTFHVALGDSLKDLVAKRESVQGPHKGIPDWAWGPWISRNSFESQAEAEEAINGMIQRNLPVAAIVQEAWKGPSDSGDFNNFDARRWPDLPGFFDLCNRHDIKNVLWQVPVIHPTSPEYAVGEQNGFFVKRENGSVSLRENWLKGFANIDFTNPEAVKYWQDLMRPTVRRGVWGFKADDGEDIKPRDVFSDGRRGWEMHNEYSTLYNRALTELLRQEGVDGLLWARSGSLGNEAYPALWAGDQYARWGQLASLLPAGLSASLSGMPFWGHDIGGYMEQPTPELYIRWVQFGALSPLMQYHGVLRREPWEFGPQAEEAYGLLARVRMNLKPALIALGRETEATGLPIMRPMAMEFPGDPRFAVVDNQYMLGPDLLVAPVLQEGRAGRIVEFPAGAWHHAIRPVVFEGPAAREVPIGLVDVPLFVREGASLRLQLRDGASLGEWRPDDPVRDVTYGAERAAIRNVKAPLTASTIARTARVEFDLAAGAAGAPTAYGFLDADPARREEAKVVVDGGRVTVDVSPGPGLNLVNQLQTYVIQASDGSELFRGSIRWEAPVVLELDRHAIPVVKGGRRSVVTRLVNRSAEPLDVRVVAEPGAGARVAIPRHLAAVPAGGSTEVRWDVDFDATDQVGDTRLNVSVLAGDVLLDRQALVFARVPRWIAVGPFPAPAGRAYVTPFAPEWSIAPDAAYQTEQGSVQWEQVSDVHVARYGGVDFNELWGQRDNAAAYALTRILSDRERDVELRFGSDDTLTVWLNGKRIHGVEVYRLSAPDQEIVKARLRAGANTLMVKIGQDKNPWNFLFRVTGPDGAPAAGLRDGFTDYGAFAPRRAVTKNLPATLAPFSWFLLGPIAEVPSEAGGWRLATDAMAAAAQWPPPGTKTSWQTVRADLAQNNLVDLGAVFGPVVQCVAYAATSIRVGQPTPVRFEGGSDDGMTVWLNGREVYAARGPRGFKPGQDVFLAKLEPGLNRLLCRIDQGGGDWKFQLNAFDLSVSPPQPVSNR